MLPKTIDRRFLALAAVNGVSIILFLVLQAQPIGLIFWGIAFVAMLVYGILGWQQHRKAVVAFAITGISLYLGFLFKDIFLLFFLISMIAIILGAGFTGQEAKAGRSRR